MNFKDVTYNLDINENKVKIMLVNQPICKSQVINKQCVIGLDTNDEIVSIEINDIREILQKKFLNVIKKWL